MAPNGPPPMPGPPPFPGPGGFICQSCGLPMGEGDYGTNADGSENREYCLHCFRNGKFTDPGVTMEKMIKKHAAMASKMGMSREEAISRARKILPTLKRWRKGG